MTKKDKDVEATPSEAEADQETGKRSLIRQPLHTLGGIIAEACRVYRQMRDGKLDHQQGRSLVWCLGQMRAMVETAGPGTARTALGRTRTLDRRQGSAWSHDGKSAVWVNALV